MTTETVLTENQLQSFKAMFLSNGTRPALTQAELSIARQAEQTILQSTELQALRKDAKRYHYLKKGNQWIVAATQTGFHVDGEDLDDLIDSEMEQQT